MAAEHLEAVSPGGGLVEEIRDGRCVPPNGNAALVFERYLPLWVRDQRDGSRRRAKEVHPALAAFVRRFAEQARSSGTDGPASFLAAANRRAERVTETLQGQSLAFSLAWRVALGLGAFHPVENGFSFDPLLGVPCVPGSSTKGLCRASAKAAGLPEAELTRLFGPETISAASAPATGDIVFHDALPPGWPKLAVDIVNCHHRSYYETLGKETPGQPVETESPIPAFFLTVEAPTEFVFRWHSRARSSDDLRRVADLLRDGLAHLGLGAKTAAGYGELLPRDNPNH